MSEVHSHTRYSAHGRLTLSTHRIKHTTGLNIGAINAHTVHEAIATTDKSLNLRNQLQPRQTYTFAHQLIASLHRTRHNLRVILRTASGRFYSHLAKTVDLNQGHYGIRKFKSYLREHVILGKKLTNFIV